MRVGLRRAVAALAAAGSLTAAAACSTSSDQVAAGGPSGPASSPWAAVDVRLMQYTHDEVNRVLVVKVTNPSDEVVRLDSVEVSTPAFTGGGPVEYVVSLPPGRTYDLRVPYGEPVCDAAAAPADLVVRLGLPDSADTMDLAAPEGSSLVRRIHDEECLVRRVLDTTPMRWTDGWRTTGHGRDLVVHGRLRVGPVSGDRPVRLVGIEGTVLFDPRSRALPTTLAVGEAAVLPVRVTPTRCDPHALGESPQGFVFNLRVAPAGMTESGRAAVWVPMVPDVAAKNFLVDSWLEQCGLPEAG